MIKVKLDEVLKERNVSLTELSNAVNVTIANLSILKTGKAKAKAKAKAVRFSTLEAICNYLDCQPRDIIVNQKDDVG
ncbi:helix-turn-helix domain-containing protein [Staphylococcus pseudintermedius]|uniref:helix-turn-helix domain-containing protein n=1 Tax=Staphylococcus pseudintermedius TaxID=283734 RepID=UPI0018F4F32B|nr:helix-turn-helix domain-containing protein [Staphylococcus pseudintermedius]EIQ4141463.1 helix-turn-helix domain-containing protein [Staphylococcus pseudintermedius]EJY6951320.1 helix-turn-helix domain-containing protein [Staphylococcus pseudintermedius]EJY6951743.1 helix-turn-helix domain-containing protein [Staphylococcus pseudintermedius]EKF8766395.1 helix-turn-helix domain-containing protein [Staphylococcus pseudintermedius]MBJ8318137.1 helix-turn-helix domain-containing protein [Staphy